MASVAHEGIGVRRAPKWSPEGSSTSEHGHFHDRVIAEMTRIHREITAFFEEADRGGRFVEDPWIRPGGGGGVTRVLTDGRAFEKVGVNRSTVWGKLGADVAERLGAKDAVAPEMLFLATGVSVVAHPRSPMVPIVHLNVRYFELRDPGGGLADAWFGGGTDLTPTYPFPDDAVHFHRSLKRICGAHHPAFYARFKPWCDRYFVNRHRRDEMRGVGGIFYDNLRSGEEVGLDREGLLDFTADVGGCLPEAYAPILTRRRGMRYGKEERNFQLLRRGRYAEFNLVHDRGTRFGLQTSARAESVLMSLPPLVRWGYGESFPEDSFQARLLAMLTPRDWVDGPEPGT